MEFNTYVVRKKPDGTFNIFRNDKLIQASVAEVLLENQLATCGILEWIYRDVMSQLAQTGEATVEIPVVTFRQIS